MCRWYLWSAKHMRDKKMCRKVNNNDQIMRDVPCTLWIRWIEVAQKYSLTSRAEAE